MKGRVRVHVTKARNLYDAQIFGKQDVRCVLKIGTKEVSTKVHQAGGTNPLWDETVEFDVDERDDTCDVVLERPKEPKNDLLGECSIKLLEWWEEYERCKKSFDKTYALTYGQKRRGELFLTIDVIPAIEPLPSTYEIIDNKSQSNEISSTNIDAAESVPAVDGEKTSIETIHVIGQEENTTTNEVATQEITAPPKSEPPKPQCESSEENNVASPPTSVSNETSRHEEIPTKPPTSTNSINEKCNDDTFKPAEIAHEITNSQIIDTPSRTEAKDETQNVMLFEAGDKIEAKYKGKQKYYPGMISRAGAEGYYDINYDDGEKEHDVRSELIRLIKKKSEILEPLQSAPPKEVNPLTFQLGEKVQVQYKGRDKLYPGKIARCRVIGTYDITYDDGEKESSVLPSFIHPKEFTSITIDCWF
ncbi:hypothetical protein THRCLA_11829 [Thraustotheca clavata]|uniref:C2 domain-containing protein n=1 Tax=Thraustotheca clavata TaxID=74557 RepID=A0A1V9Y6K4_9STRA|nr:hypothetical protein THRCLA_11829 [Thraustotheca clavata]